VDIGFDAAWEQDYSRGSVPVPGRQGVSALIDTGAQECFIDRDLATALTLPIVDRQEIAGSTGREEVEVYLAQIHVRDLYFTIRGRFCGCIIEEDEYKILIGRSFLEHFSLAYNGKTGRVTLTD
ncbi:MAG TPA: retropepsin-like aspartic protease, partial [Stellaceae bacterium]|nr:retropepsin-like aspartic protease [Stellaceae bacterium]